MAAWGRHRFWQYYGQTEVPLCLAVLRPEDHVDELLGACGQPALEVEMRLVDEAGNEVPAGTPGEIAVRIVGEDEGRALNLQYRGKDYATNVLTFDYTRAPVVAADLVLCGPVVAREAIEQGKTLQAHYAHLLVHGTLHAQGWDHETNERDALAMEAAEI
eukprot:gene18537-23686_t